MKTKKSLPPQFKELEEFLDWALPTETQRRQYRESCDMEEIREFYDAVLPRVPAILDHFRAAETAAGGAAHVDPETK